VNLNRFPICFNEISVKEKKSETKREKIGREGTG
jgi:hypothetical protein